MGCLEKDNGWKCLKRETGFLLPAFLIIQNKLIFASSIDYNEPSGRKDV